MEKVFVPLQPFESAPCENINCVEVTVGYFAVNQTVSPEQIEQ